MKKVIVTKSNVEEVPYSQQELQDLLAQQEQQEIELSLQPSEQEVHEAKSELKILNLLIELEVI